MNGPIDNPHKIYENPLEYSVFLRFEDAIRILSTGGGCLNKRLYKAYYDCGIFNLASCNFKDEVLRNNLSNIERIVVLGMVPIRSMRIHPKYYITQGRFKLHWKKSSQMAKCMFEIYQYLVDLRQCRFKTC